MTSSKTTKRALTASIVSIFLCAAMLIGTTFAWFTDEAGTSVNRIEAGTLKVDIEKPGNYGDWTSADGKKLLFKQSNAVGSLTPVESILWEPGATYTTEEFRIRNNGNLALKYKLTITGFEGDMELLNAIDFNVKVWMCGKFDSNLPWAEGTGMRDSYHNHEEEGCELIATIPISEMVDYESVILPGDPVINKSYDNVNDETSYVQVGTSYTFSIEGHMDENAGNEYQGMSLEGLAIKVVATQASYEYDSNGKDYDENAEYTEVIAEGKTFTGTATLSTGITATAPDAIAVKAVGSDANVTITGGNFDGGKGGNNQCVHVRDGATVTIKGGTFTVGYDASGDGNSVIECRGGNVVIEGGFFQTDYAWNGFYYVLNQYNSNPGTITVKGGTFVNYNPANGDDNLGGNFVADGYKVVQETQANGDVWYTVVAE